MFSIYIFPLLASKWLFSVVTKYHARRYLTTNRRKPSTYHFIISHKQHWRLFTIKIYFSIHHQLNTHGFNSTMNFEDEISRKIWESAVNQLRLTVCFPFRFFIIIRVNQLMTISQPNLILNTWFEKLRDGLVNLPSRLPSQSNQIKTPSYREKHEKVI